MDFEFNEAQTMIRTAVRDFADKEIVPVAKENNRKESFPLELVKKMGKMGFLGLILPAEYGGGSGDHISYCLLLEELSRGDVGMAATASAHMSLCGHSIAHWGTEEQKRKYLPRMATGEILGCLATTEPNVGSDISGIETLATRQDGGWLLNGNKMWITNGGVADIAIIIAQTQKGSGSKGLTAFLVERGTKGFTTKEIHNKLGLRSSSTAEFALEDCRVPDGNVLGPVGKGMSVALSAFDSARLGVAARSIGAAQGCIEASVAYAQSRKQFGKLIGNTQLVQELIADMSVEIQAARLLSYRAAAMKDKGNPATIETSMAKYYASEAALRAANSAIQIHGSYGYSDEFPVERYWRDVRVSSILEGTSQIQKMIIGRAVTGLNAFA